MPEAPQSDTAPFHDIAARALSASTITDAPPSVVEAAGEAVNGVTALLTIAETAEQKLAEWDEKGREGLVPIQGVNGQKAKIREDALDLSRSASRQFEEAYGKAEDAILASALPKVTTDREALAREEALLAIGNATGHQAVSRLLAIAQAGSPEVQGVLNTPWAKTLLVSRQVEGVDDRLREARRIAAISGSTTESVKAVEALERLKNLKAAGAAANSALHHATKV